MHDVFFLLVAAALKDVSGRIGLPTLKITNEHMMPLRSMFLLPHCVLISFLKFLFYIGGWHVIAIP